MSLYDPNSRFTAAATTLDNNLLTFESKAYQEEDSDLEDSDESEPRAKNQESVKVSISIRPCVLIIHVVLD
jgi:hypothetical protein